eukprot:TRINITY_DN1433_c0_g1_i1.p1 TRINITY_DN1433_c0_g1~~TRINITY_DN1433_c0_g1_i1.p1  ORF type:complete len:200 (+),score=48.28 TRINITY_DN1433_c0_g1_i1:215-814(+)
MRKIFVLVLVLLILVNFAASRKNRGRLHEKKHQVKAVGHQQKTHKFDLRSVNDLKPDIDLSEYEKGGDPLETNNFVSPTTPPPTQTTARNQPTPQSNSSPTPTLPDSARSAFPALPNQPQNQLERVLSKYNQALGFPPFQPGKGGREGGTREGGLLGMGPQLPSDDELLGYIYLPGVDGKKHLRALYIKRLGSPFSRRI